MDRFTITVTERQPARREDEDTPDVRGCECDGTCDTSQGATITPDPASGSGEPRAISPLSS